MLPLYAQKVTSISKERVSGCLEVQGKQGNVAVGENAVCQWDCTSALRSPLRR